MATIVTGSGTAVTYVATQDPKYTTNRKTTTTTDNRGDDVVIYPGGWRWIPIGLPPLRLPPFKLPSPPAINPDPKSRNPNDDPDPDKKSQPTTKSAECTTTKPPGCIKTVSYISSGTGFTSTILGTCPPVSGCVSGKQTTTTTTITTSIPIIWSNEPLEPDVDVFIENIDDDTIQYFNDFFKKHGISLEDEQDERNPLAFCSGNTPGLPLFCLNTFGTDFCQEVQANPSKSLSKTFTDLDGALGPIGPIGPSGWRGNHHSEMHKRRLSIRRGICSGWSFEFTWSGAHAECGKSCLDYLDIIRSQCFQFKTNDEGFLDTGCGTYNLMIKSVTTTSIAATESPPKPTAIPKVPLSLKPVVCEDEANFPGHGDVSKGNQKRDAELFCESNFLDANRRPMYMNPHNATIWVNAGFIETNLYFSVS
ncbi:hypothetical protein V8C35DRAFT_279672 [Trichoderma chlorosporum]